MGAISCAHTFDALYDTPLWLPGRILDKLAHIPVALAHQTLGTLFALVGIGINDVLGLQALDTLLCACGAA
jgi:hypothetical protein